MKFTRSVGRITQPEYLGALAAADAVLDPWSSADGNISNHVLLDGRRATVPLSAHARDLLDVASMVYIADELVPRAGSDDTWTREIAFVSPVYQRAAWASSTDALSRCLGFLSGDSYAFEWLDRPNTVPRRTKHKRRLSGSYDAVCLFSGGVDSFLGAAQLLGSGLRILLVGHYAEGTTSSAQRDLAGALRKKYPGRLSLLQVHVARSMRRGQRYALPTKSEITHRSRSFLFLGAAVAAASSVGAPIVYIPENGLIALNAPLSSSRRGTLSTRTAHPRFLREVEAVVRALGFGIRIENPFEFASKTDMVVRTSDDDLRNGLLRTVSCAHAGDLWRQGKLDATHCGYCVPCIYRRVAFVAAGIEGEGYLHDVFTDLAKLTDTTARDFRLLVRFAREAAAASEGSLRGIVLRHGWFAASPDGGEYRERGAMIRRWAQSFLSIVDERESSETRRILSL
jgi:7-cyano-7-deazaguanine synthase in queuosine biosynthesis